MGREVEPAQGVLFVSEVLESPPTPAFESESVHETGSTLDGSELAPSSPTVDEPVAEARECPKWTIRELRAVRSLLYNRFLLEVVQRRIEKAEIALLSYLLTQGGSMAQIGPYLVERDEDEHLWATQTETDGWYQPYFSELETTTV